MNDMMMMMNWNIFEVFWGFLVILLFLGEKQCCWTPKFSKNFEGNCCGDGMMMISMCTYDNDNLKLCNITIICNQFYLYFIMISFSFSPLSSLVLCPFIVGFSGRTSLTRHRVHNMVLLSPRTRFWRLWRGASSLLWWFLWFLAVASFHFVTRLVGFDKRVPFYHRNLC